MAWIITNKTWGVLVLPRHPSLWLKEPRKAYPFPTKRAALKESARWAKGLVRVEEQK